MALFEFRDTTDTVRQPSWIRFESTDTNATVIEKLKKEWNFDNAWVYFTNENGDKVPWACTYFQVLVNLRIFLWLRVFGLANSISSTFLCI